MSDHTNIEWTDATWNPITGCSVVSAGCKHCYAMRLAGTRLRHHPSRAGLTRETSAGPVWTGKVRLNEAWLDQPVRWKKPRRIFVCAHGDLFHPAVPVEWIDQVFAVMALAPQHTFQVLTKRPGRMLDWFRRTPYTRILRQADILRAARPNLCSVGISDPTRTPWSWVWLGVSVEDQPTADERIPLLLQTPAAVRFISAEPLLGPVRLPFARLGEWNRLAREYGQEHAATALSWVIVGGESGPRARPSHPDWFRILRDQCQAAGVAFFFKQWGAWEVASAANGHFGSRMPVTGERYVWLGSDGRTQTGSSNGLEAAYAAARVGKRAAGRRLDGRTWDEFPRSAP
jgi:protein gp37